MRSLNSKAGRRMALLLAASLYIMDQSVIAAPVSAADPAELSLEELMRVEVTSVSKKKEVLGETAAAVFVITEDDIRRSGVTSVPEALRLAPGLHVARVDANNWAISARGSNGLFANKLLVLVDGRSVYTPLFSGVYWSAQDLFLPDVERIEVIRGPGTAVWGANAVNGVINIITKDSKETQGGQVNAGVGTEDHGFLGVRQGFEVDDQTTGRVYAKYYERDDSRPIESEQGIEDGSTAGQGGARFDWSEGADTVVLQGDMYSGESHLQGDFLSFVPPFVLNDVTAGSHYSGGNVALGWKRAGETGNNYAINAYYDRTNRSDALQQTSVDTYDVDGQVDIKSSDHNTIIVGLGARAIAYEHGAGFIGTPILSDVERSYEIFGGFLQDEYRMLDDKLRLTLGSKLEYNEFSGTEPSPSARVAWVEDESTTLWAGISRAVRSPSIVSESLLLPYALQPVPGMVNPVVIAGVGNSDVEAEELWAYEVGARFLAASDVYIDVATFYNRYDDLADFGSPSADIALSPNGMPYLPVPFQNIQEGDAYGGELLATWLASRSVKVQGWYSFLASTYYSKDTGDLVGTGRGDPEHQAMLRGTWNVSDAVDVDVAYRWIDVVPSLSIPAYSELNVRLGWRATPDLELALVGVNLLHAEHKEYASEFLNLTKSEAQRAVLGELRYKF